MSAHTQSLLDNFTTEGTFLAGVSGINLYQLASSFFRFLRKDKNKGIPCRVCDRLCQVMILKHPPGVEILNNDNIVFVNKPASNFMRGVSSLISDVFMRSLEFANSLASAARAFNSSGNLTLLLPERTFRLTKIFGRFKEFAVRSCDKVAYAHIESNDCTVMRQGFGLTFSGEANIITTSASFDNCRLNIPGNRPVLFKLYLPNILDVELAIIPDFDTVAICEFDGTLAPI